MHFILFYMHVQSILHRRKAHLEQVFVCETKWHRNASYLTTKTFFIHLIRCKTTLHSLGYFGFLHFSDFPLLLQITNMLVRVTRPPFISLSTNSLPRIEFFFQRIHNNCINASQIKIWIYVTNMSAIVDSLLCGYFCFFIFHWMHLKMCCEYCRGQG